MAGDKFLKEINEDNFKHKRQAAKGFGANKLARVKVNWRRAEGGVMEIKELQKAVDDWANQFEKPYFEPLSMMACLTEEVGEVARCMNNLYGDKKKKTDEEERHLVEELGDLLFSMVCLANSNNISLEDAIEQKFKKVTTRDINRWKHKDQ